MKTFKQVNKTTIRLTNLENDTVETWNGYEIGSLPPSFAFKFEITNEEDIRFGVDKWFNYKGLTYVRA
jgi:hypothetical protein|tara:strand:+ start:100 stop:303 length:204 start_codon:yes stop_codon:yes gene_type:complete